MPSAARSDSYSTAPSGAISVTRSAYTPDERKDTASSRPSSMAASVFASCTSPAFACSCVKRYSVPVTSAHIISAVATATATSARRIFLYTGPLLHSVAHAAKRGDLPARVAQLLPKRADVHVHRAGIPA